MCLTWSFYIILVWLTFFICFVLHVYRLFKKSGISSIENKIKMSEMNESTLEEEKVGDFLLTTERLHDCFFVVGNLEQGPIERIGAVKACLMNQSRVFRNMLHDSRLAERGDISVPDIQPSIFLLLLRHCYGGLENCRSLTFEDTVKLCYAAEKYLITSLKKKIADRLKPECASDVFPGLHCLVTFNVTDLESYVTEIVREQTEKIFSSEGFLDIDVNSLVFILRQDTLNCAEIDLWKAVVRWANHKAQKVEGTSVKEWMSEPLKHIRLMTLSYDSLCQEILPTKILTFEEFCQACSREGESTRICCVREARSVHQERWKWWETVSVTHERQEQRWARAEVSYSCLLVGERSIMLESLTCLGSTSREFHDCYGLSYPCQADITVSKITDYISSTSDEEPTVIKFSGSANYFEQFTIPTLVNGESIVLKANSMYKIKISFTTPDMNLHPCWNDPTCSDGHTFSHGKFYCSYIFEDGVGWKPSHIIKFQYSYRK